MKKIIFLLPVFSLVCSSCNVGDVFPKNDKTENNSDQSKVIDEDEDGYDDEE